MSAQDAAARVWLSRHIHVCQLDARFIVLNVARDEYLSIEGAAAACLAEWVRAWVRAQDRPGAADDSRFEAQIGQLLAQGVLTRSVAEAREKPPILYGPSRADRALDGNYSSSIRLRPNHVLIFLWSLLSTAFALRFRPLQSTLSALAVRRIPAANARECSIERAGDLIAIFRRLRSVTFATHRRCLLHAITLTKFLAHFGIQASFVMGVKVEPWAAHSWVELGDYVLDGTPEQARFYHRILVI